MRKKFVILCIALIMLSGLTWLIRFYLLQQTLPADVKLKQKVTELVNAVPPEPRLRSIIPKASKIGKVLVCYPSVTDQANKTNPITNAEQEIDLSQGLIICPFLANNNPDGTNF